MNTFDSPQAFARHLKSMARKEVIALRAGLTTCAKLIKKTAKEEIGHLQPAVGPFAAWAELADYTKKEKEKLGYKFNDEYNPLLREGTMRDSYQYEVNGFEAIIGSKMDIAAWHEFGTSRMPERPVLGPAAFRNKEKIKAVFGSSVVIGVFGFGTNRASFLPSAFTEGAHYFS